MTYATRQRSTQRAGLLAVALIVAPTSASTALGGEILYAPFSQTGGVATAGVYSGDVWVTVSGAGQALGSDYSDAFYVLPGPGTGYSSPTRIGYWDLAVGASPINGSGSQEASNSIVGPVPAYNSSGVYSFQLNAGATPTQLHFGVDDNILSDNTGAYTIVVGSAPTEVLYAPFDNPGGAETAGTYYGKIMVTVSGVGQALGSVYSDAFYALPGPDGSYSSPTRIGYWDLAVGASPINGSGSQEASNSIVGPVPAYNSSGVYSFQMDIGSAPTHLYFGVDDNILSDNAGAYTIAITELSTTVPEPATWMMLLAGLAGLGLAGYASRKNAGVAA